MGVCVCVCVCVLGMSMCDHVCSGPKSMSNVSLDLFTFETGSLTEPGAHQLEPSWLDNKDPLVSPSLALGYRHMPPCLVFEQLLFKVINAKIFTAS